MILNCDKWNRPVFFNEEKLTVLNFGNLNELYLFQKELISQVNGAPGFLSFFDDEKPLKVEKEVEIIDNLFTLTINNRKTINYLYKNLSEKISKSDKILKFEELAADLFSWLREVRKDTLVDFDFEEELEISDILKLAKISFAERDKLPSGILIKYLDLLREMSKIKVVFITFATYLLSMEEIKHLIKYCYINKISLLFIEKENILKNEDINLVTIVDDCLLM